MNKLFQTINTLYERFLSLSEKLAEGPIDKDEPNQVKRAEMIRPLW